MEREGYSTSRLSGLMFPTHFFNFFSGAMVSGHVNAGDCQCANKTCRGPKFDFSDAFPKSQRREQVLAGRVDGFENTMDKIAKRAGCGAPTNLD